MDPIDALLRYPIFALLGRPLLEVWAQGGRLTECQTGQTLLQEGARGRYVCVLMRGRVRLSRATPEGRERTLGILEAGAVFGEYALIKPHLDTATCRTSEACQVFLLPLALLRPALRAVRGLEENLKNWLRLHALVHHFRHSAGLCFLTAQSLVPMLERCQEIIFGVTHTLQAEGLLDQGWLFLQKGEVLLDPHGLQRRLGPGDCLGEAALLGRTQLPQAVALAETTCWHLPRENFLLPLEGPVSNSVQTLLPGPRPRPWEWLAQRGPADCGPTALAMALRGLDMDVTLEQVARLTPLLGPVGVHLTALATTACKLGVRATAVRLGIEQLRHARLPAVAHLLDGHFVTLFEVHPTRVVVGDPATGISNQPLATFQRGWSGNLLLLAAEGYPGTHGPTS